MVAFAMNGQALPLLNGFPLRLVVPGLVFDLLDQGARPDRGC
ncbi:molybdopterin-dependent oxidoreductase [Sphingomonas adhaesiva]